jgi:hypothetical protein
LDINTNAYYNAGYKYISSQAAALYTQTAGQHIWYSAASGTAGNAITFKQAMTLDNAGTLTVGDGSIANQIQVNSSSWANHILKSPNTNGGSIYWNNGTTNKGEIFYYHVSDYMSFTTNSVERARIDSSGNLLVGTTSANSARVNAKAFDSAGNYFALYTKNSSDTALLSVRSDGYLLTGVAANSPYNATTAYAGNVFVQTDGGLYRSTSSLRYKTDVQNAVHGLAELMKLRPVTYKGKNDGDKVFGGLIAEEVHDAGLAEFVLYDLDSNPDAIFYGPMVSLCIKAMQEQQALIESLTARLNSLENK